jgi:hypothetical protein
MHKTNRGSIANGVMAASWLTCADMSARTAAKCLSASLYNFDGKLVLGHIGTPDNVPSIGRPTMRI